MHPIPELGIEEEKSLTLFENNSCAVILDPVFCRTKIRLFGLSRPCKAEDDNVGQHSNSWSNMKICNMTDMEDDLLIQER